MSQVKLGDNEKIVDIPDEMLDQFDSGQLKSINLKFYAISSGQANPDDFPEAFQIDKPEVSGALQAMMIGAGRELARANSNLGEMFAGSEAGKQREQEKQAEIARLAEPVKEEYPKSSFVGEMLPGMAIPGGRVAQVAAGAGLGALEGDSPGERMALAAIGGLSALGGQKLGDYLSSRITPKIQQALGSTAARARDVLTREGVPLTFGQRGSPVGKFVDVLKSTITRSQPLMRRQIRQLNRLAANAIGENSDDLSKPVLGRAAARIGATYDDIARNVGEISIGPEEAKRFLQIDDMLKSIPEPSKVTGAIRMVEEIITNPEKQLNGASYQTLRTKLWKISNQLWRQGSGLESEVVDELIDTLDDSLARAAPEAQKALDVVRPQWRFLRVLRRGASVDDLGNINPRSMSRAMESVYPGFDIGRLPAGAAGRFGRTLDAFQEVVKPFKSSGTGERIAALGIPIAAGLGLSGMTGPGTGLAALLATGFGGGGSGAQLGGNLSRALALALAKQRRETVDQGRQ